MGQTLFERGDGGAAVGRLLKKASGERVGDNGAVSGPSTPRSLRPTGRRNGVLRDLIVGNTWGEKYFRPS